MHSCWLTRALLTFDILAVVCAALAQGPEVDTRGALGRPAGVDHLEGLEGRDQHLLLPRKEGVTLDGGSKAGPDAKESVFPKVLGRSILQGCGGKAPQPDGGPRPRWPEAQALHPSEHLVALGWTLAAAQQLQGFGQQEVECLEGEVLEVVGPGATRLTHSHIEFFMQGAVGRISQQGHPVLFSEAQRGEQTGRTDAPLGSPGLALPPLAACLRPAISVHFVGLELCAVEIRESSRHGCGTASILVIKGGQGHV